jgi:hypothetical protein
LFLGLANRIQEKEQKFMIMKTHTRIGILSLVIGLALVLSMGASGAATTNATKETCRIAVHLETSDTTREELANALIRELDDACNVLVSDQEVQDAANTALYLISESEDPVKGVIRFKTRKYEVCISWGGARCP